MNESNNHERSGLWSVHIKVLMVLARYYLALRLSASIVAPSVANAEWLASPAPVVRSYEARRQGPFDERELIQIGSRSHVLIQPFTAREADAPSLN